MRNATFHSRSTRAVLPRFCGKCGLKAVTSRNGQWVCVTHLREAVEQPK